MLQTLTLAPQEPRARQMIKLLLPREHGSWSLALEPLVLGLLAAPSALGVALAAAALAGFFLRRPLKIVLNRQADARRPLAGTMALILGLFALGALAAVVREGEMVRLWPLAPAALAALAFVWFDSRNEAREGAAELAGVVAFGVLPAACAALAGWGAAASAALAAVMLARSVPTVLVLRVYMRRRKGCRTSPVSAFFATGAAVVLTGGLVWLRLAPWPAAMFTVLLAGRAVWLLGGHRRMLSPGTVGVAEMMLGWTMVLTVAALWKRC